jgi:hypothetical protein
MHFSKLLFRLTKSFGNNFKNAIDFRCKFTLELRIHFSCFEPHTKVVEQVHWNNKYIIGKQRGDLFVIETRIYMTPRPFLLIKGDE